VNFLTSSTTSCHQCSAGPLSSPSSRRRVSANCGSWCQASQSARALHVPTITRLSGLSDCWRSCPPTQPGVFFAADRRVRIAVSHSRPAPSFRCTCVTIVIIELVLLGPKSRLILAISLDHLIRPRQQRRGSVRPRALAVFRPSAKARDRAGAPTGHGGFRSCVGFTEGRVLGQVERLGQRVAGIVKVNVEPLPT
jgi:hypothetical protein